MTNNSQPIHLIVPAGSMKSLTQQYNVYRNKQLSQMKSYFYINRKNNTQIISLTSIIQKANGGRSEFNQRKIENNS